MALGGPSSLLTRYRGYFRGCSLAVLEAHIETLPSAALHARPACSLQTGGGELVGSSNCKRIAASTSIPASCAKESKLGEAQKHVLYVGPHGHFMGGSKQSIPHIDSNSGHGPEFEPMRAWVYNVCLKPRSNHEHVARQDAMWKPATILGHFKGDEN